MPRFLSALSARAILVTGRQKPDRPQFQWSGYACPRRPKPSRSKVRCFARIVEGYAISINTLLGKWTRFRNAGTRRPSHRPPLAGPIYILTPDGIHPLNIPFTGVIKTVFEMVDAPPFFAQASDLAYPDQAAKIDPVMDEIER